MIRFLPLLAVFVCLSAAAQAPTDDVPAANPGRPTVSNPATLPPVGYLQLEQGYLGSLSSPETASQYGANVVAKLAVHPRLMLSAGFQPFAASNATGFASRDAGGIQLGLQAILFTPQQPAPSTPSANPTTAADRKTPIPTIALGYAHGVYAGTAPDIDLGSASNSVILFFSGDIANFHYDTNYALNEQVDDTGVRRAQFGQTLSVNHALFNPNLQLSVELYHFTQPFVAATAAGTSVARANLVGLLFAPSYQLRPNLVLDAGFERGLTSTSTQWQSFAGFTYVLPHRLWPQRRHG